MLEYRFVTIGCVMNVTSLLCDWLNYELSRTLGVFELCVLIQQIQNAFRLN